MEGVSGVGRLPGLVAPLPAGSLVEDGPVPTSTDVPEVVSDEDVASVRAALVAVPVEDPRDGPWVAAQWFGAAGGATASALAGVDFARGPGVVGTAIVLTLVAQVAARLLAPTRPPAARRTWLAVRVVTLAWAVSVGVLVGGLYGSRGTALSWTSVALAVGVLAWVGFRRLATWRARPADGPSWPRGTEALAVLAVVEDARRVGVHPRQVASLAGLDEARARSGLDALAADGLVVGARVIAGRESSRITATHAGREQLAQWKRALGWT